jgi:hypothetical protein
MGSATARNRGFFCERTQKSAEALAESFAREDDFCISIVYVQRRTSSATGLDWLGSSVVIRRLRAQLHVSIDIVNVLSTAKQGCSPCFGLIHLIHF